MASLASPAGLPPAVRATVRSLQVAMLFGLAALAGYALLGIGADHPRLFNDWLFAGIILSATAICIARAACVRENRAAWSVLSLGLVSYSAGMVLWQFWLQYMEEPPFPSVSDPLWLALYPAGYVAIGLMLRRTVVRFPASLWLDGVIAALAVAALVTALSFNAVVTNSVGSTAAIATNLAYPVGDVVLAAFVVGFFALSGWRPGRAWMFLGAGFAGLTAADVVYVNEVAAGTYKPGGLANLLWAGGIALLGLAAWQRPRSSRSIQLDGWATLVLPLLFTLTSLGVLVYDHFTPLNALSVLLAAGGVLAATVRTAFTFGHLRALMDTKRLAMTDDLTDLPNRRAFVHSVAAAVATARRRGDALAVVVLNLDRFKELNDTLGHPSGDQVLRELGPRLRAVLRPGDTLARIGGDEFALLLPGAGGHRALQVVERLRGAIAVAFEVQGLRLRVTASAGIALFPDHSADGPGLLRQADIAMHQAKTDSSGYAVYSAERDGNSRDQLILVSELERALTEHELVLHYQPKCDPGTGMPVGVEALVRWQHPERGLLPPGEFLPAVERSGLMRPLTLAVLGMALEQCRRWEGDGLGLAVAVNIAAPNLLDLQFPDDVERLLRDSRLEACALQLEVTEDTVMADPVRAADVIARLSRLGVSFSLDDFGRAYSSLAYLKRLPVAELKIDRSFVTNMASDHDDAAIVRSVIELGHALGLSVVAEGVEDAQTQDQLGRLGCDLVQGFHLARPLAADDLSGWLAARTARLAPAPAPAPAAPPRAV